MNTGKQREMKIIWLCYGEIDSGKKAMAAAAVIGEIRVEVVAKTSPSVGARESLRAKWTLKLYKRPSQP